MADNDNLHNCFETLIYTLHQIKYNCKDRNRTSKELVVQDAIDKGLLGYEPEDIQDKCYNFQKEIIDLENDLENIVSKIEFKGIVSPFQTKQEISAEQEKSNLIAETKPHLEYYHKDLQKIIDDSDKRIGFKTLIDMRQQKKIRLNLQVNEIIGLFVLLFDDEVKIIDKTYSDGTDLKPVDLIRFIENNFSSKTKKNLSIRNFQNNFDIKHINDIKMKAIINKLNSRLNGLKST